MMRTSLFVVLGVLVALPLIGGLIGIKVLQFQAMGEAAAQMQIPPERVNVAVAREEQWHPRLSAIGTVTPVQGTTVSTEAEGVVREILFQAGEVVEAGRELLRLDMDVELAQLEEARAVLEGAELTYRRASELIKDRNIPESDFSDARVALNQARAQVDNIRAVIARRIVRAPFSGRLGIRRINVGQFLQKGSPVVSLQFLDPVFVEFYLPQQNLSDIQAGQPLDVISDAYPGRVFEGAITAIEPEIDAATRNVRIQATLPNPGDRLRPGMFVSVDMQLPRTRSLLFIPLTAVHHASFGDTVFVLEESEGVEGQEAQLVVQQRVVSLGVRQGDFVAVLDGLESGEQVVSTGVFKLQPGMPVVIDNTLAPEFSFNPRPDNS